MTAGAGDARVRVDRFTWERLMLVAPELSRAAQRTLLVLAVYMDRDGAGARPGMTHLADATRTGRSTLAEHLGAAVATGYLQLVERGGYRGARARASTYAATVPAGVHRRAAQILGAPPWRSSGRPDIDHGPMSGRPDIGQRPATRTLGHDQCPDTGSERPDTGERTSGHPDPITQYPPRISHHPAATPLERQVCQATGATLDEAREVLAVVARDRGPADLAGYVTAMHRRGDLAALVARLRTGRDRAAVRDVIEQARSGPLCVHGEAGGSAVHPTTGEPLCALCRSARRRAG